MIERQHVQSLTPSPQVSTKERSVMPDSGTTTVTTNQQHDRDEAGQRQHAEPQRPGLQPLAAHRDIALRLPQQQPLHEDKRRGDGDDHHHDHGHELIGRHAELVGELVEIGREHQHALRIAEHQRQAEQFEAEEEHQHAGKQDRRQHHRQADVDTRPEADWRRRRARPPRDRCARPRNAAAV